MEKHDSSQHVPRPHIVREPIDDSDRDRDVDRKIVRPIAVPSYLVWLAIALITGLSGGPVYQLVMVQDNMFDLQRSTAKTDLELQQKIADSDREIASMKVKQDDILNAVKALTAEMSSLNRSIAIINSKMP